MHKFRVESSSTGGTRPRTGCKNNLSLRWVEFYKHMWELNIFQLHKQGLDSDEIPFNLKDIILARSQHIEASSEEVPENTDNLSTNSDPEPVITSVKTNMVIQEEDEGLGEDYDDEDDE